MKRLLFLIPLIFCLYSNGQVVRANPYHRPVIVEAGECNGNTRFNNFVTATGVDPDNYENICWLIDTLESTNLDDSLYAFYPIVGGTATTHAYNIIDTGAYKLSFSGTITHASTGMKGNGTNGYANTGFNPNSVWSDTLGSIGLYSRTSGVATGTIAEMGASNAAYTQNTAIWIRFGDTFYGLVNCSGTASNFGNTSSDGFYMASRYAHPSTGNRNYLQKNTTQELNSENPGRPNLNLYLMALNENGTAKYFSTKELTCAFIGKGISAAGGLVMQKIIASWNTKNGR